MATMRQQQLPLPILATCGDAGLKQNCGYINEEFLTSLKGVKGQKKFREMADNDAPIASALYLTEALLSGVTWTTKENKSGHELAAYCTEKVDGMFEDMTSTWTETMSEILTALVFGWCVLEPCYKIRRGPNVEPRLNSQHTDGLFGWLEWAPRSQDSLEKWEFTEEGRVVGMWQRHPTKGKMLFVPSDRWLHFKFRGSKNNPEGRSALRGAYMSYYFANRLREIEAIGIERNIAGMPDIQVPPELLNPSASAEQRQTLAYWTDLGKKIRTDSLYCIVRPSEETPDGKKSGYKVGLLSSSGRNFAETDPIIKRHEQRELMTFLAEMLAIGSDKVGSYSMHSDKTNNFVMALTRVLDTIDAVTNRDAIPRIGRLNGWPIEALPTREHGDIEKTSVLEWAQAVSGLVSAGALEADDHVRSEARRLLDVPEEEVGGLSPTMEEVQEAQPAVAGVAPVSVQADAAPDQRPDMLNVDEASDYLRVSRASVMSAVRRGQLPGAKVGSGYRIARADLDKYLLGSHGAQ